VILSDFTHLLGHNALTLVGHGKDTCLAFHSSSLQKFAFNDIPFYVYAFNDIPFGGDNSPAKPNRCGK